MYGLWILYMQCGEHCPFSNHLHISNEDGRRCLVGRGIVQILTYFIQLLSLYISNDQPQFLNGQKQPSQVKCPMPTLKTQ
jgi:hypothetical protein